CTTTMQRWTRRWACLARSTPPGTRSPPASASMRRPRWKPRRDHRARHPRRAAPGPGQPAYRARYRGLRPRRRRAGAPRPPPARVHRHRGPAGAPAGTAGTAAVAAPVVRRDGERARSGGYRPARAAPVWPGQPQLPRERAMNTGWPQAAQAAEAGLFAETLSCDAVLPADFSVGLTRPGRLPQAE